MLLPLASVAQSAAPRANAPQYVPVQPVLKYYTTSGGATFQVGDSLRLGRGTGEGGSFRFIYVPTNPLSPGHRGLAAEWQGRAVLIRNLRAGMGASRQDVGQVMAAFRLVTLTAFADLEQAVAAGEVVPTRQQQMRQVPAAPEGQALAPAAPGSSPADELLKLKTLLDSGAITPAEYEQLKARVIGR